MSKRALFLSVALFMAVAMSAKVYIPLVKSVPPGTAGGGAARVSERILSYSLLAYYEVDTLYIQYPFKTTSSVIITDDITNDVIIRRSFNEESNNVKFTIDSLSLFKTYNIYIYSHVSDSWWAGYFDYLPTTHVQEKQITLTVGESYQLHVTPDNAKVIWVGEPWKFQTISIDKSVRPPVLNIKTENPIAVIDDKGLITALRKGNTTVFVESFDGSIREQCQITVCERETEDRIFYDSGLKVSNISPAGECEWTDVSFSLSTSGEFEAEGTFYGSGAQENRLNQIVTDQCIFLYFEIDHSDTTKGFYTQPFKIQMENCNAQEYTVYFKNSTGADYSQNNFTRYTITKGSSTGNKSEQSGTDISDGYYDQGYPLNLDFVEVPDRMFIKKEPGVTTDYVISLLKRQFDDNYQIYDWIGDICNVTVKDSLIDNAIADFLKDDSVSIARRVYAFRVDYEYYLNTGNANLENIELYIFNEISYVIKKGYEQIVMDSLADVFGLVNIPNFYFPEWAGDFVAPNIIDIFDISTKLYNTGFFTWIVPEYYWKVDYADIGHGSTAVSGINKDNVYVLDKIYYNLSGQKKDKPSGLTIIVTRYSDGSIITEKKLFSR